MGNVGLSFTSETPEKQYNYRGRSVAGTNHGENQYRGATMETNNTDILAQNKVIFWIAFATGLVLLVPLLAMQFSNEVAWTLSDFVSAGALVFGTGLMFVLAARKLRKYRAVLGVTLAAALIYVWAELAVGIFTTWGS